MPAAKLLPFLSIKKCHKGISYIPVAMGFALANVIYCERVIELECHRCQFHGTVLSSPSNYFAYPEGRVLEAAQLQTLKA